MAVPRAQDGQNPLDSTDRGLMQSNTYTEEELPAGTRIADRYEILSVLGRGSMGVVYKARHEMMGRVVAIKMLRKKLVQDERSLKRFEREAKAASRMDHPNIITVHDFGLTGDRQPYLVMDYARGITLYQVQQTDLTITPERAVHIFAQVCDALHHAHLRGVIHRDLKPSNIMISDKERISDFVRVFDLGVAKIAFDTGEDAEAITRTGEVCGSPLYLSPEQCKHEELDPRSDIYSMGVVMYEMLTGKPPLMGETVLDTLYLHVHHPPPSFNEVTPGLNIPVRLEQTVLKALEKEPYERHQTMQELKHELLAALEKPAEGEITVLPPDILYSHRLRNQPQTPVAAVDGNEIQIDTNPTGEPPPRPPAKQQAPARPTPPGQMPAALPYNATPVDALYAHKKVEEAVASKQSDSAKKESEKQSKKNSKQDAKKETVAAKKVERLRDIPDITIWDALKNRLSEASPIATALVSASVAVAFTLVWVQFSEQEKNTAKEYISASGDIGQAAMVDPDQVPQVTIPSPPAPALSNLRKFTSTVASQAIKNAKKARQESGLPPKVEKPKEEPLANLLKPRTEKPPQVAAKPAPAPRGNQGFFSLFQWGKSQPPESLNPIHPGPRPPGLQMSPVDRTAGIRPGQPAVNPSGRPTPGPGMRGTPQLAAGVPQGGIPQGNQSGWVTPGQQNQQLMPGQQVPQMAPVQQPANQQQPAHAQVPQASPNQNPGRPPNEAITLNNEGNALIHTSPNEAIAKYQQALAIYPGYEKAKLNLGVAHMNLAISLQGSNNVSGADSHYRQALGILRGSKYDSTITDNYSNFLEANGRGAEAQKLRH